MAQENGWTWQSVLNLAGWLGTLSAFVASMSNGVSKGRKNREKEENDRQHRLEATQVLLENEQRKLIDQRGQQIADQELLLATFESKLKAMEKLYDAMCAENKVLKERIAELEHLAEENQTLKQRVSELEQSKTCLENRIADLEKH